MIVVRLCIGLQWVPTTENWSSTCLRDPSESPAPAGTFPRAMIESRGTIRSVVPTAPGRRSSRNARSGWPPHPRNRGSRSLDRTSCSTEPRCRGAIDPIDRILQPALRLRCPDRDQVVGRTKSTDRAVDSHASSSLALAARFLRDFSRAYRPSTSRNGGWDSRDRSRMAAAARSGSPG